MKDKLKLFYLSSVDISGNNTVSDGVIKKIMLEIRTMNELGFEVSYIFRKDGVYYLFESGHVTKILDSTGTWRYDLIKLSKLLRNLIKWQNYSRFYFRFEGTNMSLHRLLSHIHKHSPQCEIMAEIPTMAKKWEPGTPWSGIAKFFIKKINNQIFSSNIDRIITFDENKRIFGRPCINIENFADVESLPVRAFKPRDIKFHILGVAMMTPSHGFDRVIRGIKKYYLNGGDKKIIFHIVGRGPAQEPLQQLTQKLAIEDSIVFEGVKATDEISSLVNICHVAVGALAIFRKRCAKASELKIREYCARAIPFIYSAYEPMLDDCDWCLKVPNDESEVDIQDVIEFAEKVNHTIDFDKSMRDFAIENCTCRAQLKKIFV